MTHEAREIRLAAPGDLEPSDGYRIAKHASVLGRGVRVSLELHLAGELAADAVVLRDYGDSPEAAGAADRDILFLAACCRYLNSGGRDLKLVERVQDLLTGTAKLPFEFKLDPDWKLLATLHEERVQHIYADRDGRAVVVTEDESVAGDLTAAQVLDWIEQGDGSLLMRDDDDEAAEDS